jgi:hypothetical protein
MSEKIDLEKLEQIARDWADEDAEWYPGQGPAETLALIARIRELESAFGELLAEVEERSENPAWYAEQNELLNRGTVLR